MSRKQHRESDRGMGFVTRFSESAVLRLIGRGWVALGLIAMFGLLLTRLPVAVFLGAVLLAGGLIHAVRGLRRRSVVSEWVAAAPLIAAGGVLIFWNPDQPALQAFIVGTLFLAEGLIRLFFAVRWRHVDGAGWALFGAGLTFALAAAALLHWPSPAGWVLGLWIGLYFVMNGWALATISRVPDNDP